MITLFTQEQLDFIIKLQKEKIPHHIALYSTTESYSIICSIHNASQYRQSLLKILGKVNKEVFCDNTITGRAEVDGIRISMWDWDVCKVVGYKWVEEKIATQFETHRVKKPITDCMIREGRATEAEIEERA